jgi:glycerol-3-phosphate dehydrogenase (NAD(P)+)
MGKLLALVGGGAENIVYGASDLYVTIFGGRTRQLGALLGQGLSFDEAMAQLSGVTLESVSIAARAIRAVETMARRGMANKGDYPLLFHVGRLLSGETGIPIPWAGFEVVTDIGEALR